MSSLIRLASAALVALPAVASLACTNFIVTPAASADGSTFISYNADDYGMFGSLCHYPAAVHAKGAVRDIVNWDTHVWAGQIPEVAQTYNVIGNINEFQVAIGETTYGGREEMVDTTGLLDYGSLIYLALQRSRTAREAIEVMTSLANRYGYSSEGETFSIADPREAWIMEMMGKGPGSKGVVFVALRVPDGYICAHANQSRIGNWRKLGLAKEDVIASKDVVSFARRMGWFRGKDEDFSWRDAYCKPDFEGRRLCDARVWSFFRRHADDMERHFYWAEGRESLVDDLPLWVRPNHRVSLHDVMMGMRDHYEGTPFSLADTTSLAGGPWMMPYRPTPLVFKGADGRDYFFERPTSTQQTAFTFVAQLRSSLPDHVGGILWFGNDDANMVAYTPVYCASTRRPLCYNTPGADAVTFSFQNAFWVCNWVANMVYPRYSALFPDLEAVRDSLESSFLAAQAEVEAKAAAMPKPQAVSFLNDYSIACASRMMDRWNALAMLLIVKHNDMAVKPQNADGSFSRTPEGLGERVVRIGYPEPARALLIEQGAIKVEYPSQGF